MRRERFSPQRLAVVLMLALALLSGNPATAKMRGAETPMISGGGEMAIRAAMQPAPPLLGPIGPYARNGEGPLQGGPPPDGAIGATFDGFGFDDNTAQNSFLTIPPDPIGAAGTDRVIGVVNSMIEARTKTGVLIFRDSLEDLFSPLAPCAFLNSHFDPKVVYDHYENRFVVVALQLSQSGMNPAPGNLSRILLAVSKGASPATATAADWWFHCIDSKFVLGAPPVDYWTDYPGFEVDEEAVYVTGNLFDFAGGPNAYGGVRLWIVHKGTAAGFYAGGAATVTMRDPYAGDPNAVPTTTMPAEVYGAGGVGPGIGTFLVSYSGINDGTVEAVQVMRVDDPLGTIGGPTFVGSEFIVLGNIELLAAALPDAPQLGSAQLIEVNDRRALDAVWRDGGLWLATTVNPDGPALPALADHTTAYWIELDTSAVTSSADPAGLITLSQQGGIEGEDLAAGTYTYFPSVAVNGAGNAVFGFAASAPTIFAGAYATGRRAADPAGFTMAASTVRAGADDYVRTFDRSDQPPCSPTPFRNRWGDYSGISLDPTNDWKFWVYNQFADLNGTPTTGGCNGRPNPEEGRWGTGWASFGFVPDLDIDDVSLAEGNAGVTAFDFTVSLSNPAIVDVTVDYDTADAMATTLDNDYVGASGTLTIPAKTTSAMISVDVNGDLDAELDEDFLVDLTNPAGATIVDAQGQGTILNDDGPIAVEEEPVSVSDFALRGVTPNPSGGSTRIEYALPHAARVRLSVVDVAGREVAVLADGTRTAGDHHEIWDGRFGGAREAPAGVYFVRFEAPHHHLIQRMVVLR